MLRHKYIEVGASASGETLVNALSGLGEKNRKIKSLAFVPDFVTSATYPARGTRVRAYKNQDQIVDAALTSFAFSVYSSYTGSDMQSVFELDMPLKQGDGFKVGLYNSSATPSGNLQIVYEDME